MKQVASSAQFKEIQNQKDRLAFFLFYTDSSADSKKAFSCLDSITKNDDFILYSIDASSVKDIHGEFGIDMVPTLLVMRNGKLANLIFGVQNREQYRKILEDNTEVRYKDGDSQKRVVIYTSDGCSWCTKAISYLKKMGIVYREINVSRNPAEAERLVAKTGQRGAPQLDIGGQFVVGFDQKKIDRLLGI